jgi:hypothetical protein
MVMPLSGRSFPLMNETSFPNLDPLGQLALERVDRPLMAYPHRFFVYGEGRSQVALKCALSRASPRQELMQASAECRQCGPCIF